MESIPAPANCASEFETKFDGLSPTYDDTTLKNLDVSDYDYFVKKGECDSTNVSTSADCTT